MVSCQILRLDPSKRRGDAGETALPAYSAMTADGVMVLPAQRRQAEVVECEEVEQRRRRREAARR
jgi:hypothetical protein